MGVRPAGHPAGPEGPYPGFSGGPLVDTQGRVVGLNSWHLAGGQELAIPAAAVGAIVQTLVTQGRIRRAYLGVTSQPVALPESLQQKLGLSQKTGLVVVGVESGSPAEQSGLLLGDIVVVFAGQTIADPRDLQTALGAATVGAATARAPFAAGGPSCRRSRRARAPREWPGAARPSSARRASRTCCRTATRSRSATGSRRARASGLRG